MKEKLNVPGEVVIAAPDAAESPPGGVAPVLEDAKDRDDEDSILLHVPLDDDNMEQKDFT